MATDNRSYSIVLAYRHVYTQHYSDVAQRSVKVHAPAAKIISGFGIAVPVRAAQETNVAR